MNWVCGAEAVRRQATDSRADMEPELLPEVGTTLHAVTGEGAACGTKAWSRLSPAISWPPPEEGLWEPCYRCLQITDVT